MFLILIFCGYLYAGEVKWDPVEKLPAPKQFEHDTKIFMNTLFPDNPNYKKVINSLNIKEKIRVTEKDLFLKKVILLTAGAGLQYTTKDNDRKLSPWPFSIASSFSHGQRILIHFDGNPWDIFNFLTNGNKVEVAKSRGFASHGTEMGKDGKAIETKLKGAKGAVKTVAGGIKKVFWGVALPLGGIGNINHQGHIIGANGYSLDKKLKVIKDTQHGHLFIRIDEYKKTYGVFMYGLEGASPGKTNMWGIGHDATSGFADQTKSLSVTGGLKWKALGVKNPPAEYGGKVIMLDTQSLKKLSSKIDSILKKNNKELQNIFNKILNGNGKESHSYFEKLK